MIHRLDGTIAVFEKPVEMIFHNKPTKIESGYKSKEEFLILRKGLILAKGKDYFIKITYPIIAPQHIVPIHQSYFSLYRAKDTFYLFYQIWARIEGANNWELGGNYLRYKGFTLYPSFLPLIK